MKVIKKKDEQSSCIIDNKKRGEEVHSGNKKWKKAWDWFTWLNPLMVRFIGQSCKFLTVNVKEEDYQTMWLVKQNRPVWFESDG